jgi:hypothetical protein
MSAPTRWLFELKGFPDRGQDAADGMIKVAPSSPGRATGLDGETEREVPRPRAAMARVTSPSSLSCESANTDESAAHRENGSTPFEESP